MLSEAPAAKAHHTIVFSEVAGYECVGFIWNDGFMASAAVAVLTWMGAWMTS